MSATPSRRRTRTRVTFQRLLLAWTDRPGVWGRRGRDPVDRRRRMVDIRRRGNGTQVWPDKSAPVPVLSSPPEEPSDSAVLDGDGRGVAGDHGGAAPAAGGLHGGGRGTAADEL